MLTPDAMLQEPEVPRYSFKVLPLMYPKPATTPVDIELPIRITTESAPLMLYAQNSTVKLLVPKSQSVLSAQVNSSPVPSNKIEEAPNFF